MKSIHRLLGHPLILFPAAIGLGLLIHHWTSPTPPQPHQDATAALGEAQPPDLTENPAPLVSANPPPLPVEGEPLVIESLAPTTPDIDPSEVGELTPVAVPETTAITQPVDDLPALTFREIWGYLMSGEEDRWHPESELSDVVLFAPRLDQTGKLVNRIRQSTYDAARARHVRVHLAIASAGQAGLLHFLLDPRYGRRDEFLRDIVQLATERPLDGLQLDFESMRVQDRPHFESFLIDLRSALPDGLIFSLAIPARHGARKSDAFAYDGFAPLADRFLIMVYDEHWKGGPPGSISSGDWHRRVTTHSLRHFPPEKLIVGLPFYGRVWQLDRGARATRHSDLEDLAQHPEFAVRFDASGGHRMQFQRAIRFEGWFEDSQTAHAKMWDARTLGAWNVGFWRLGQEDGRIWQLMQLPAEQ